MIDRLKKLLKSMYWNVTVGREKKHTYLGMQLGYTKDGKCKIGMVPYTDEIINYCFFKIQDNSES